MPHGGFGDPENKAPFWAMPEGTPQHKVDLAQAQHRLMCAVRIQLQEREMTEAELAKKLGYKHDYLIKKMNGIEAVSARDLVAFTKEFGPEVAAVLAG